ncbi:shikimate kinase [Lentisphaerota bacterium WC36G]|nr:hypothetical protein LJT99_00355 [Lentisphaerae bacterium WC36]
MRYIFIGMKHCGKSSHGKLFAEKRNLPFFDTDDLVEELYAAKLSKKGNCREIFNEHGAEFFAELEKEILAKLLSEEKFYNCVIAMGGRMPVAPDLQNELKKLGCYVYIKVADNVIFERIKRRGFPSFVDQQNPYESVCKLIRDREVFYDNLATITINVEDLPKNVVANKIAKEIEEFENNVR